MNDVITRKIRSLAESTDTKRPSTSLRKHIAEIDAAIAEGVKIEAIQEALASLGIEMGPHALRGVLYRYRKQQREKGAAPLRQTPATKRLDPVPETNPRDEEDAVHQPIEMLPPDAGKEEPAEKKSPWAYKSPLRPEEKEYLSTLSPTEKIEYFRQQAQRRKFTHNPTPERFRKEGE